MSNRILNLIFKADTNKASGEVAKFTSTIENMATSVAELEAISKGASGKSGLLGLQEVGEGVVGTFLKMLDPVDLLVGGLTALGVATKKGAEEWLDYALEVGNLSDSLQLSADDASTLMGIMDKFSITTETMTAVFRNMAKDGLSPTLKNLQLLLEEYDNIASSSDKMLFATKKFGDQGLRQLIPAWEQLTEAEKDYFTQAESNLEISREQVERARDIEEAQSQLSLMWTKAGGWLAQFAFEMTQAEGSFLRLEDATVETTKKTATYIDYLKLEHKGLQDVIEATEQLSENQLWDAAAEAYLAGNFELAESYRQQAAALQLIAGQMSAVSKWMKGGAVGAPWSGFTEGFEPQEGGWTLDALGRQYKRTEGGGYELGPNYGDFAAGGSFRGGGSGGPDSTPVGFNATPGEIVSVGGGTSDMENILSEIQRLVDSLPLAIADAVERR